MFTSSIDRVILKVCFTKFPFPSVPGPAVLIHVFRCVCESVSHWSLCFTPCASMTLGTSGKQLKGRLTSWTRVWERTPRCSYCVPRLLFLWWCVCVCIGWKKKMFAWECLNKVNSLGRHQIPCFYPAWDHWLTTCYGNRFALWF